MHHENTLRQRTRTVGRRLAAMVATVGLVMIGSLVTPASALETDSAEAEGRVVSGGGTINLDGIASLAPAYSADPSAPGTVASPLQLSVLNTLGIDLGGGVQLFGPNGVIAVGALEQYATTSDEASYAASGAITQDGAIAVGGRGPQDNASVDVTQLLGRAGVAPITQGLISQLRVELGALSANAESVGDALATGDYQIADGTLIFTSPVVSTLTTDLGTVLTNLSTTTNAITGPTGSLGSLLPGIANGLVTPLANALRPLTAGLVNVTNVNLTAGLNVNLNTALSAITAQPLTSPDSAVSINFATGEVRADIARLIANSQGGPYDGTLNNLAPNTEILSTDLIQAALDGAVGTILDQVPALLVNTATGTLNSTAMSLRLTANAAVGSGVLAVPLVNIDLTVNGTVGQFLGLPGAGAPTIDARRTSALGLVPIGTLLTPILGVVTGTLLPAIVTPLANAITGVGILDTAFRPLVTTAGTALAPVVGVINQVLSITANVQEAGDFTAPGGFDDGAFTQRAVSIDLLPLLGTPLAEVDLASATVRSAVIPAVEVAITAPADGDVLTVPSSGATVDLAVTGTGEIGADVSVAAPGLTTQTTTVAPDGTWTVTFPAAGVGSYAITATQDADGEVSTAVVNVSVEVGEIDDVTITAPTDGTVVTVPVGGTTDVLVTGSGQIGASVVVALPGQTSQTVTVQPDGTWTATFVGVGAGSYDITATQAVGNQTSSAETTVVVDEVLAVGITLPAPGTVLTVPDVADTTTLTVTGTGDPGADVVVSVSGQADQTVPVGPGGTWSATFTGVGVGDYTVTATQTVGDQTTDATTDVSVVVGVVADVAITLPTDGAVLTVPDAGSLVDVAVTGTGEVGADVLVTLPGWPDQSTTVGADGTWTVTFPGVELGARTITATQTLGSSTSVAAVDITIEVGDVDDVTITAPTDGQVITVPAGATSPLVTSGAGQIGASVVVSVTGQPDQTVTVGPDGTWTATFPALPEGTYTVTATQDLGDGSTATVTVEIDAVTPVVVTAPVDGSTTTVPTGETTDLVTTGTGEAGADVLVSVTGQTDQTVPVSPGGTWTATFPGLGAGDYTVTAAQVVGDQSTTSSATVSVVEAEPVVITAPGDGDVLTVPVGGSTDLVITGSGEIGAQVVVAASAAGQLTTTVGPDGTWTVTFPFLGAGPRTVTATQTVGDLVTDDEITVDIVAVPAVTITAPTDGTVVTVPVDGTTDLLVTGTGAVDASVLLTVPGLADQTVTVGPDGTWTASYTGLGEGSYPVTATQTVGTQTTTVTVAVEVTEVDALTITSPADGAVLYTSTGQPVGLVVEGTGEVGASVTVSVSGQPDRVTTVDADGTWGVTYSALGAGAYSFVATQLVGDQLSSQTVDVDVVEVDPVAITAPLDGDVVTVLPGGSTDLEVTGTGEIGAEVVVSVTGQDDQTVTVGPDGTWTATFLGLPEGAYEVAAAQLVGDLPTVALVTVTVEAEAVDAVTITAPLDEAVLNVAAGETTDLVVTGSGDVGAEVVVSVTGEVDQTVTVEADGTWTATFPGIGEGTYTVGATQTVGDDVTDAAVTVVVDGVDAATITAPVDGAVLTAPAGGTADLTVTGAGDPGAEVVVSVTGEVDQTVTVEPDGTWTATFPGLAEGAYTIDVTQTVGGVTSSDSVTVEVDGVESATITAPLDGEVVSVPAGETTDLEVTGTGDPGAEVVVSVTGEEDQTVTVEPDGTWSATFPGIGEGEFDVTVTQTVGDQTTTETVTVVLDGVDAVTVTAPVDGSLVGVPTGETVDLDVTGTGDIGAEVVVTIDGEGDQTATVGPDGTWTVTFPGLAAGTYEATATQTVGGVTSVETVTVEVVDVDELTVVEPVDGDVIGVAVGGTTDLEVTGTGDVGADVVVTVTGQDDQTVTVGPDGTWTASYTGLGEGTYAITATQTVAGLVSTVELTVEVDGVDQVAITAPTDGTVYSVPLDGSTDLVVEGTGDVGADIIASIPGQPDQETTVGPDGTWTVTFPGLEVGTYEVTASQLVAGQLSTAEVSVEVEVGTIEQVTITAPVTGDVITVPEGDTTDLVVSGTGEVGGEVVVSIPGQDDQVATVEPDGTWTVTFPGLGEGTYTATATHTAEGQTNTAVVTVEIDGVVPVTVTDPADGDVLTVPVGGTTTLVVTGTGDPGADVLVEVSGQPDQTVEVGPDGTWTATFPGLPADSYDITVTQTVGDQTTVVELTVEVDAVEAVTLDEPADGDTLAVPAGETTDLVASGTGDPGAEVEVTVTGQPAQTVTVEPDGTWTATFPGLGEGTYTVTVSQTVGDQTTSESVTVEVDGVDLVTVTAPAGGSSLPVVEGGTRDLVVSGTGDAGAEVVVSVEGEDDQTVTVQPDGTWTATFPGIGAGTYEITASQTVNGLDSSATLTVTVDEFEAVVVLTPADGDVVGVPEGETLDLDVTGTGDPGAEIVVSIPGQPDQTTTVEPDGTWTVTFPGLPAETYEVTVTQTVGDQTTTETITVEIDGVVQVAVTAPTDGSDLPVVADGTRDLVVSGSGDIGAEVVVSVDGQTDQTVTVQPDGTWTATFPGIGEGTYEITATQTVNGQTSTQTVTVTVTEEVDVLEAVAILTPEDGDTIVVPAGETVDLDVTGSGEPGADVAVTVEGQGDQTVTVQPDGTWTATFPGIGEGTYEITATQTVGGQTTTDTITVVVDEVAPVAIVTPADGDVFRALTSDGVDLVVTGTGDVGADVVASLSGAEDQTGTVGPDGTWTVTFPGLPEGTHEVVASQLVGDQSTSDTVTVEVDTVDDVVITSPADGEVFDLPDGSDTVDLPVVGDGEVGADVLVSVEGQDDQTVTVQPDGTWTADFPGLGIGTYDVTATQTVDELTSTDEVAVEVALEIQEISPVIITSPADGTVLRVPPGEVTDLVIEGEGFAGADIEVTATGQEDLATTVAEDGTWTATFADVPTGTYAITAWQMADGTVTNDSIVLVVDDAEIVDVDITSPLDGDVLAAPEGGTTQLVVVGTGEPTADVVVTVPGQEPVPTVVSDDGSWTVTFPEIGAGAYTVLATQTIWDETSTDLVNVLVESEVSGVGAPFATVKFPLLVRGTGMVQEVYGTDFVPGETVSGEVRSTPLPLAPAVADAEGNVTLTFLVDEDFEVGTHQVFLTGSESGPLGPDQLATGFVVIDATDGVIVGPDGSVITLPGGWMPGGSGGSGAWGGNGSGSGPLARTGADDLAVGLLSGTLLLLVGGGMLAVRRRRTGA
ncbi:Ig-like domain-containing protein [Sanguibacter keddieii DSM 10542]|uniref:Ig-like domain-containing protein n=1 Tax=Sanguibacter keddieii (strain ATCC 51767 / DSM 10542 / NCFB 3025 / ST-74) TaxID=446469 RepID=D1BE17_SANKS|nr:choice-of-anchor G family protein [Sanguibacter keddieii]ACZ23238.1 Ig-like domain-containing protein [Sanguibacter keddieii DSM 10542]